MAAEGLAGAVELLATVEGTGAVTVAVEGGGGLLAVPPEATEAGAAMALLPAEGVEVGLPICW